MLSIILSDRDSCLYFTNAETKTQRGLATRVKELAYRKVTPDKMGKRQFTLIEVPATGERAQTKSGNSPSRNKEWEEF